MDDEKLIELVHSHPAIYDPSHKKYMDTNLKTSIWNNIGREIGVSGALCKSRWYNIRDNFRKSIQKNATKSGRGRKSLKPYKYHEQLSFLVEYFGDRSTFENVTDNTIYDEQLIQFQESALSAQQATTSTLTDSQMQPGETWKLESDDPHTIIYPSTPSPTSQQLDYLLNPLGPSLPTLSSTRRRLDNTESLRTVSMNRQNEHPVDIFLASLAPTLKELHPCDLFEAKSELYATVQKYELKQLKLKFPKKSPTSSIQSYQTD